MRRKESEMETRVLERKVAGLRGLLYRDDLRGDVPAGAYKIHWLRGQKLEPARAGEAP